MRFSTSNGHTVMGVGDATVSVDNAQVPHAGVSGEADWIDESRVGYRFRGDDGVYHLAQWALGTPQPALLDEQSATTFRAGGGVWAAFLAGSGVRTSTGKTYPVASLCDVSPDGKIVLCPDYQVGRGLQIIDRVGGEFWVGTGALGADATGGPNVRLRDGVLLYQADAAWHLERLGSGAITFWQRAVAINYAVPVVADGEVYILEREAYRLTLRKASGVAGWVIATGEALFSPDAIQVVAGAILCGWTTNQSEKPGTLVTFAQSLSAPTSPLDGEVPVNDPAKPPSSPIITFPGYRPPPQASYGRPGYCGPYFATDLRTGNFNTPGNTEMVVNGTVLAGNQQVNRPVFVSLQSTGNDPNKMLGFLAGACDDSMGNAAIKSAWNWHRQHGHISSAMVRYYDGTPIPQDFIDGCEREAIVQVQCYPRAGESVSASMARFTESVDRVIASGRKCGIARAFNTKYGGLQTVLDIQDPLCAMVRARPQVILDAWFSWGRWYAGVESGAAYQSELIAWASVLGGLFTGLP